MFRSLTIFTVLVALSPLAFAQVPALERGSVEELRARIAGQQQATERARIFNEARSNTVTDPTIPSDFVAPISVDGVKSADVKKWLKDGRSSLGIQPVAVGQTGAMNIVKLQQILGDDSAIVVDHGVMYFAKGFDFSKRVDGQWIRFAVVRVTGTKRLDLVTGATKQVFEIGPTGFDLDEFDKVAKKIAADATKQATELAAVTRAAKLAAIEERKFRTWESADRAFSVKAKLIDFKDGKATLERKDGAKVSISPSKLSESDREFIREELKRRRNNGE